MIQSAHEELEKCYSMVSVTLSFDKSQDTVSLSQSVLTEFNIIVLCYIDCQSVTSDYQIITDDSVEISDLEFEITDNPTTRSVS